MYRESVFFTEDKITPMTETRVEEEPCREDNEVEELETWVDSEKVF
jgi:hypothetical protein